MNARSLLAALLLASSSVACAAESGGRDEIFEDDDVDVPERSDRKRTDDPGVPASADSSSSDPTEGGKTSSPPTSPTNTCEQPVDLGSIAGDKSGPNVTHQGTCSQWLRIRADEMEGSVLAGAMKLTVTLVPPSKAAYDLFVYVNKATNAVECSTPSGKGELPDDSTEAVQLTWGETLTANGGDDSRPVSIEVRAKDPDACAAAGSWTLLVEGNK